MLNCVHNTFLKLFLAMLILFSAAVFVVTNQNEVQAQSGTGGASKVSLCFNSQNGATTKVNSAGGCDSGTVYTFPAANKGVCIINGGNSGFDINPPAAFDATGNPITVGNKCADADHNVIEPSEYRSFASIGISTTPPVNPPTTNPLPGTTPGTGTTPGGGGTNTGSVGCESGFHKVGPLCVPTSPFGNNNTISGETTVGGLAARIVRILLYFAGIVAVIMAIVGGYQVMTAGGNESQATSGRKTLTNAIIGLAIVILSYIIIQAVISFVTK